MALPIAVLCGSCSLLVDRDRQQCAVDGDCRTGGDPGLADAMCVDSVCQPNPTWRCLQGSAVAPPTREPRAATVIFRLRDLILEQPALGVTARLCRKLDYQCDKPLVSGMRGDADGNLTVEVGAGFDGYVELSAPDRLPGIYFFYPPVDGDREIPNVPMIRPAELFQFAQLAGRPIFDGYGHVMLGAYDCQQSPAADVRLSSEHGDEATTPFYLVKKLPTVTASGTDSSGRGGLINLRPGIVSVSGHTADGRHIATLGIYVRSGAITYTTLLPAP